MFSVDALLAHDTPTHIAIESDVEKVSYQELRSRVEQFMHWLKQNEVNSLALYAPNCIDWIVVDLACQKCKVLLTPIPLFFSDYQRDAVIASVKPNIVISDTLLSFPAIASCNAISMSTYELAQETAVLVPDGTTKITYTSGSTGAPKGVCLSMQQQLNVAFSLVSVIDIQAPKHLCLLPLPTLLENVAGIYSPLLAKGTIVLASDEERGFKGSQLSNSQQLLRCISNTTPNTLILVPELLQVLVLAAHSGWSPPSSLQFIAVGGSKVSPKLLQDARNVGLPVCQGYGLSECASVVSLCTLKDPISSAGKLLPHLQASIVNSELVVSGNTFLGYLEDARSWHQAQVFTGDIALLNNNELTITGRLKNILINSLGRNISPEWIESELMATSMFRQVVVIGDAKPFCSAIVVPINTSISYASILDQVARVNAQLPDYARIHKPIVALAQMTPALGLYTENMRPKRKHIYQRFQQEIENVYSIVKT